MAMPSELSSTRPPTTRTTRRTDVRKRPVTPRASARRSLAVATSESSTPATVMVTERMMAASSTTWICAGSRGAISTVALLNWMAMGLGSFFWGALSDRIGGRGVALGGGLLLGLGLVLASQAQALWQFYVTFGFLVGFAVGAFYAPLTSTA